MTERPSSYGEAQAAPVRRRTIMIIATAVIAIFVLANVHLIYVAFRSQPDCVIHLKSKSYQDGAYRAAQSAC